MGCSSSKEQAKFGARPYNGQHEGQNGHGSHHGAPNNANPAPTSHGYQYGPNEYGQYGTGVIGGEYQVYYGPNEHGQYGVSGQGYKTN